MLVLEQLIKAQLQDLPELTGWQVRTGTDLEDRKSLPAIDIRLTGADIGDVKAGAAMVSPVWTVTVVVKRGADAAASLDAAFAAIFASLHNWAPGAHGGRCWERMRLLSTEAPLFADAGVCGVEILFQTSARYLSAHH